MTSIWLRPEGRQEQQLQARKNTLDLVPPEMRAENAEYRMASGIANSLAEALQQATTNLSQWLADDYKLTPNEIALVLGTAIQYDVASGSNRRRIGSRRSSRSSMAVGVATSA